MKIARHENVIEKIRQQTLDTALDIIIRHGFDGLTMRRLAAGLNMTAPNIYNYFANKDEIYIAIVIRGFEMLQRELVEAYERDADPIRRARSMIQTYLSFGMNSPRYYEIMFIRSTPRYKDYVGTPLEKLSEIEYRISMEIVELAVRAASEIMAGQPHVSSDLVRRRMIHVWSLLHGMISLHHSANMEYVAEDPITEYSLIIDDLFNILFEN